MKSLLALLTLLVGCSLSLPSPSSPQAAPVDITERTLNSVVALTQDWGTYCAGVLVEQYVLTAAHCVEDSTSVEVAYRTHPEETHEYLVLHVDVVEDVAVLLAADNEPAPIATRLSPDKPWVGREAIVVGHPYGLTWTVTTGIVSSVERTDSDYGEHHWFQISAPVSPGNSGGPVFNRFGEVMGIVSFRVGDAHLGGAVSLDVLREIFND